MTLRPEFFLKICGGRGGGGWRCGGEPTAGLAAVRGLLHGFEGAGADAFAAFDAEVVVDDGVAVGVLGDGSHGAYFDEGA